MRNPKAQFQNSQDKQLWQELEDIQQDWNSIKRAKPRPHLRRFSTGGTFSEYSIATSLRDRILEISPRSLMSSLQENRRKHPVLDEGLIWKVRNNDIVVQEILNDRRAALASGKLKGRRLFEGSEDGGEICSECFEGLFQGSEVRSLGSYHSDVDDDDDEKKLFEEHWTYGGNDDQCDSCLDSSSLSEEKMRKDFSLIEGEKGEKNVKEKRKVQIGANLGGKNGGRWMLAMAWFALVTMVLTFGLIVMSCNGGNLEVEKVFLIPT